MRKAVMILIAAILLCGWNVNADSMAGEETYELSVKFYSVGKFFQKQ